MEAKCMYIYSIIQVISNSSPTAEMRGYNGERANKRLINHAVQL